MIINFLIEIFLLLGTFSTVYAQTPTTTLKELVVTASKERRKFLPAMEGAKIYQGKKTSVVDLQEAPIIINNNYRQALNKTPGLLLSEESTPLLSIGYRGLTPDRVQFMQVLKDGVPIQADLFGYPEAYYTPPFQTVDHIDFIRGGSSLMYGPQPGGALNFVTKEPYEGRLSVTEENSGGSHGLFSNYTGLSGTQGAIGYYGYFHHRQSQGFRENNSQYDVFYGGSKLKIKQDPQTYWGLAFDSYNEQHGEPGGLLRGDWEANPSQSTRLNDHFELNRYAGALTWDREVDEQKYIAIKTFGGYYERLSWRQRTSGSAFGTLPSGANANSNEIQVQEFYTGGGEIRFRQNYEALGSSDHALTTGIFYYHSNSPRIDKRGNTADAEDGLVRKDADRSMDYVSLFAENMFKFGKFSVTPGARLENIWQRVEENDNVDKTNVPLADESQYDFVSLFGLGAVYELTPAVDVYSNISQGYRPKLFVEAVPTGSGQTVTEDLEEGESWQADLGLRGLPTPYYSWDGSVFYMEFRDQIGTIGSTGQVIQNVGDAQHYGFEFTNELNLIQLLDSMKNKQYSQKIEALNFFTNVMFLHAEFVEGLNSGKTPQYAPDYIFKTGLEYRYKDKGKLKIAGTFVDDHFGNDSNTSTFLIPSYKVWDLSGEWDIYKDTLSLFGGIHNLFDEQYYARVTSTGVDPADGQNFYAGARLIW